jgi:UDP-N-acetylmuramoylalanine--D-glutamate ligase
MLNLSSDHIDRHGDMAGYAMAKRAIFDRQAVRDLAVIGTDDSWSRDMASWLVCQPARVAYISETDVPLALGPALPGAHNAQNAAAVTVAARFLGISDEIIAAGLLSYPGLPHRQQRIAAIDGVTFVNDSKATNADAAIKALRAFPDRGIVWIGGGETKGVGPEELAREVSEHARHAVLNGATGSEVDRALANLGYNSRTLVDTLAEAVRAAHDVARPGDVVLLAPGYTSFDQFTDYEQRGEVFAELVHDVCGAAGGTH